MRDSLTKRTPADFELNAYYERLIELRRTNIKAFNSLSPVTRAVLIEYEKRKLEHEQVKGGK